MTADGQQPVCTAVAPGTAVGGYGGIWERGCIAVRFVLGQVPGAAYLRLRAPGSEWLEPGGPGFRGEGRRGTQEPGEEK